MAVDQYRSLDAFDTGSGGDDMVEPDIQYMGQRRYMVISDMHLDEQEGNIADTLKDVREYQESIDADGLILGGDQKAYDSELERIFDGGFDSIHLVEGNHDVTAGQDPQAVDPETDWRYGGEPDEDVVFAYDEETVSWADAADTEPITFLLGHDPDDVGSGATYDDRREDDPEPRADVLLYGHSHMPYDRIIDGTLHIGMGSLLENYNVDHDNIGERSFHVIDVTDDTVSVTHVDFETGEPIEHSTYRFDGEAFDQDVEWYRWDAPSRHDERWDGG